MYAYVVVYSCLRIFLLVVCFFLAFFIFIVLGVTVVDTIAMVITMLADCWVSVCFGMLWRPKSSEA